MFILALEEGIISSKVLQGYMELQFVACSHQSLGNHKTSSWCVL